MVPAAPGSSLSQQHRIRGFETHKHLPPSKRQKTNTNHPCDTSVTQPVHRSTRFLYSNPEPPTPVTVLNPNPNSASESALPDDTGIEPEIEATKTKSKEPPEDMKMDTRPVAVKKGKGRAEPAIPFASSSSTNSSNTAPAVTTDMTIENTSDSAPSNLSNTLPAVTTDTTTNNTSEPMKRLLHVVDEIAVTVCQAQAAQQTAQNPVDKVMKMYEKVLAKLYEARVIGLQAAGDCQ